MGEESLLLSYAHANSLGSHASVDDMWCLSWSSLAFPCSQAKDSRFVTSDGFTDRSICKFPK